MTVETHEFQAEARQLLDLVVHSIYSNKDIFLRELLSNSSDALDKLRLEGLVHPELGADLSDLHIRLEADPEKRTLKVIDNGLGMTREEVRNLIGTIARSGTAEFLSKLRESRDQGASAEMIGQFGVGFYSVFMVTDRVVLETRRAGQDSGTRWESTGEGTYTLQDVEGPAQGTVLTLHLKPADSEDGLADYTSEWVLRGLVKRYSDFLSYPIRMQVRQGDSTEDATLNSMKALWARPTDEVKPEEYHEFYRHVAHDWTDPLETIPMKGEGTFEFQALLFIPSKAPLDLFVPDARRGVQLYVKKVFIMDRCEELLPEHLRFMRGVVDAQDLSLNVSREILQKDRQIRAIRKGLTRKVTATLKEMKDEPARGLPHLLERIRTGPQGGPLPRTRPAGHPAGAVPAPLDRILRTDHPGRLRLEDEARAGGHLLPDRREPLDPGELSPPGGLPPEGLRGAAPAGCRGRRLGGARRRLPGQALPLGLPQLVGTGERGGEEGSRVPAGGTAQGAGQPAGLAFHAPL